MKLSQIRKNPNNPRIIRDEKFEKLKRSIQDFPQMMELRPIVVDEDGVILGGNMRYEAIKSLKMAEFPDDWVKRVEELTEEQKKEFIVKDNVGFGDWDWDSIANDWDDLPLDDWGLDIPSFQTAETFEATEDEFDTTPPLEAKTVLGDLYEIGEHRLLCGDSTQIDAFQTLMRGELADMVVTDPPYNVAYKGKTQDALTLENDAMDNEEFYTFLYDFYTALTTVVKKGGAIYVWHAASEIINFAKAMVDAGWLLKQQLIWVKNTMVIGRQDYQWKHEPCLYGWLKGDSHKWYSDRKQTTVIECNKPTRNGEHPTMKPIGVFAYQITNSSKRSDIVIDAFGGSGTTMVACEQLKRKARVIEYNPKYCDVILKRMKALDSSLVVKRNGEVCKDFDVTN